MDPILLSVILGLTAAAANGFGGYLVARRHWERSWLKYFVALGSGFMLATAILEMVPESLQLAGEATPLYILAGYLVVHFSEHTLAPHFHFGEETHHDEFLHRHTRYRVLVGLCIHTFFDGIAIASGFLVSAWLGWVVFLAVFLHKVPEGFTVASVMLASGGSRKMAMTAAGILGAATMAGVLTMSAFQGLVGVGLPMAAGVTLYVAASDLIPEVNKEPGVRMAILVFAGVAMLFVMHFLFRAGH